jgi:hypothetical protein
VAGHGALTATAEQQPVWAVVFWDSEDRNILMDFEVFASYEAAASARDRLSPEKLDSKETDFVRTNMMFMTAQVLKHLDPNLDLHEYAAACGVPRSITHRTNGSPSGAITYGLRWKDSQAEVAARPGAPLWRVQVQCEVDNLVVFKRLLSQVDGLDPTLPAPEVVSPGGAERRVTLVVREWDEPAAGTRAVGMVSGASLSVMGGTAAVLLKVEPFRD